MKNLIKTLSGKLRSVRNTADKASGGIPSLCMSVIMLCIIAFSPAMAFAGSYWNQLHNHEPGWVTINTDNYQKHGIVSIYIPLGFSYKYKTVDYYIKGKEILINDNVILSDFNRNVDGFEFDNNIKKDNDGYYLTTHFRRNNQKYKGCYKSFAVNELKTNFDNNTNFTVNTYFGDKLPNGTPVTGGHVAIARFDIAIPYEDLAISNKITVRLFEQKDIADYEFILDATNIHGRYSIERMVHRPSTKTPGKMEVEVTVNPELRNDHVPYEFSWSGGTLLVDENNSNDVFVLDNFKILSYPFKLTVTCEAKLNEYVGYPFFSTVMGKAYIWPDTIKIEHDAGGYIKGSFEQKRTHGYPENEYYTGGSYEIQRSTTKDFSNSTTVTVATIPYVWDREDEPYEFVDDIRNLGKDFNVYYRLRRTNTADNWQWGHSVNNSIEVHQQLATIKAGGIVMTDTLVKTEVVDGKDKVTETVLDNKIARLSWTLEEGVWPSGTELVIYRRNITKGSDKTEIAHLKYEDAIRNVYYDESITAYNRMEYWLQIVIPEDSKFEAPLMVKVPGTAVTTDLGTIRNLNVSKGYFTDRVELQWEPHGGFDGYRIRRAEYGGTSKDTILISTVAAAGNNKILAEDSKGIPGIYYTYLVDGYVHFENEDIYSNVLSDVGFSSPTGNIYGRITFENGQAVPDADVLLESNIQMSGQSIILDGSKGYLKVDKNITTGDEYTVQVYISPADAVNANGVIIAKEGEYELSLDNGKLKFTAGSDVVNTENAVLEDGRYTHVTAVRSKTKLYIYIDGEEAAQSDVSSEKAVKSESPTYIGRSASGSYYKGNIDEIRLWSTALDKDIIKRDYTRKLYGGETSLAAYWRFDDGITHEFYDISYQGNEYHANHGKIYGAAYDSNIPDTEQLRLKGITDENGNYEINGIPFVGRGTTYRVIPRMGTHKFDPSEHQRLISMASMSHTCDFTDNSSFPVTGYVYYENTNIPVKDAMFKVDGTTVMESNGEVCKSDENGRYSINVPVGYHEVKVYKNNHVFKNDGRFTDSNGKNYNYYEPMSSIILYDSTRVKLIGRVAGGAIQDSYVLGHSLSKNNLGEKITVTLKTPNDKYKLNIKEEDVTHTVAAFCPGYINDKDTWEKEHFTDVKYKGNSNIIEITPDVHTGEFTAWVIPENFIIDSATAAGYGSLLDNKINLDLSSMLIAEPSLNEYSVKEDVNGDTITTQYSDTLYFNSSVKIIKRNTPTIQLTQLKNGQPCPYFGDISSTANTMDGKNYSVKVYDESTGKYVFHGHPFFTSKAVYKIEVSAFEEYPYYDEKGKIVKDRYDRVPVSDGIASFNNYIGVNNKSDTLHLDKNGKALYTFEAGKPDITDTGLKKFEMSLEYDTKVLEWKGNPMTAYVTGSSPKGTRFVTKGPNRLNYILRDPPGSNSYSYIEEGFSMESSNHFISTITLNEKIGMERKVGGRLITFAGGPVAGKVTSIDLPNSIYGGVINTNEVNINKGESYRQVFTTAFRTSDSPEFVGADGDLFIGNGTNITYGSANCVYIIPTKLYDPNTHHKLDEYGDYCVVRAEGMEYGMNFATLFAYPQKHIETVLIPELRRLRNSFILPKTMTEAEAQGVADSKGIQMYLSKLDATDKNYGRNNIDSVFVGVPGFDGTKIDDGPSYKTIVPKIFKTSQNDTIMAYNEQIKNWISLLERNEREKLNATLLENYSFHSGSNVEYSQENSFTYENRNNFLIGIGGYGGTAMGFTKDETGLILHVDVEFNDRNGREKIDSNSNRCKTGFVFSDVGLNEYHTVDVCTVPLAGKNDSISGHESYNKSSSFVFRLRGGASACPYERGYNTRYYNPGTVIDQKTAQIEVPVLKAEKSIANNIPASRKAVYRLQLSNASEIESECVYDLNVLQKSNPDGAKFYVDGAPIGNGLSFIIPGGSTITKTLEVGIGSEMSYKDLQLILHSQCDTIADTLNITANFVPSCSDIHLAKPNDKWVLNSEAEKNTKGNYILNIRADEFDVNYKNFRCIKLQYKPSSASDAEWVDIMHYFPTDSLYNSSELGKNQKAMIPDGGVISYDFDVQALPDQAYDICAVAVCANGIETISEIASGIKDTQRPELFGSAQPANGILGIDDEIRLNFNEPVAEGLLSQLNFEVTGTRNGAPVSRSASVRFDGKSSYLATETERNLTDKDFTVETGIYIDTLAHESTIFSHGNINNSFEISITPDKHLKVKIGRHEYVCDKAIDMKNGEWEHIAVIYDGDATPHLTALYNKVEIMSIDVAPYTGTGNIEIGKSISGGNYFCGKMSEMRIWDRALTLGTLSKNKDISLRGSEQGLMAYYPMNECSGNMAFDKARGSNAVMKNAHWFINRQGYAAEFNGTSYVRINTGDIPISSDMDYTIEFWFRGEPGQKNVTLFANGRGDNEEDGGSADKMFIGFDDSGKLVLRSNGYVNTIDDRDYLDNAWHHYALTVSRNIGRANIYVDEILKSYFDAAFLDRIESGYAYLGARAWNDKPESKEPITDQFFKGTIDEFRIWNIYKNSTIVSEENNINLKGSEMGLYTYYPFEKYKQWNEKMEMEFTTSDMTIRKNGPEIKDALTHNVTKTLDSAPIKDRGPIAPVQIKYVVNKDALIINNDEPNGWNDYEESIVTFKVKDVKDEHRNAIKNPIAWTAYIDRNHLVWSENKMEIFKDVYDETQFTMDIVNLGGYVQNYSIENQPSWLDISPAKGSIDPKSSLTINFDIDEGLNVGTYNEIIYLVNENGVARALELTIKVNGEKPNWEVNPADFKYNMSVYGKLRINNIFSADKEDVIAAFMDGRCVGVTHNRYFKNEDMWYAFLTIYGNEVQQEGLEFRIWDDSTGKIYLASGNKGDMPFVNNKIYGTPDEPVIFDGEELMYQNINLQKGWNWISFNLQNDNLSDVNKTLGNGSWSKDSEVKNDRYTDSYSEDKNRWIGTLSSNGGFNNQSMYMIKSDSEQVLSLWGSKVNTFDNPVSVSPNWNYIGYTLTSNMSVKEALADYKAEKGDIIKSQTGFSMYSEKNTWVGSLTYLEADRGYMLYRNPAAGATTFKYPSTMGSMMNLTSSHSDTPCATALRSYAENMNVIATTSGAFDINEGDDIRAYINGELRGSAQRVAVGNGDSLLFFNISGDNELPVTFAVERNGKKIAATAPLIKYRSNNITGSLQHPLVLEFIDIENDVNVYPRIFDSSVTVTVMRSDLKQVRISIYNTEGRIEKEFTLNAYDDMMLQKLDLSSLVLGHHIMTVSVNGENPYVFKVEKKQ